MGPPSDFENGNFLCRDINVLHLDHRLRYFDVILAHAFGVEFECPMKLPFNFLYRAKQGVRNFVIATVAS